jgi:hypothetical protein
MSRAELQESIREFLRREGRLPEPDEPLWPVLFVNIPGGRVKITQSAERLFEAIAPRKKLFYRGGVVVELVNEGDGHAVEVLDAVSAQSRFEEYVEFFKEFQSEPGTYVTKPTVISKATAEQYLKSEPCRRLLPKLNGVLRCPLLVEREGKLHSVEDGYDEATGFFVEGAHNFEEVELKDAVEYITTLLYDFDFVTPGDRSRAIASLLTPALKLGGLIKGPIPVDVAEANASQSGKTYRQRMVAALYNHKPAVVTKKGGGVGSMEETFSDHLVKGRVFIQFDNVRGKLDSQYLESFLTAEGTFPARIPYHGSVAIDPSKFIVFISSNGFQATEDLANRACIIRIRKREHHQYRILQGKDILQLMFEWQPLLIGAVFAVINEWHEKGKPRTNETRHDFREWCQVLDWIVQNIFHEAPLMDGHQEAKQRATSPQLTWLRTVAIKVGEEHKLDEAVSASMIAELCLENDIEIPGLPADKQNVEEGQKQVGRILGKLFGKEKSELTIDDHYKVVKGERISTTMTGNPQTLKNYTFSLIGGAGEPQQPPVPPAPSSSPPATPSEPTPGPATPEPAPGPATRAPSTIRAAVAAAQAEPASPSDLPPVPAGGPPVAEINPAQPAPRPQTTKKPKKSHPKP